MHNQNSNRLSAFQWCGEKKYGRKSCPAKNSMCYTWNNKGHFSKVGKVKKICMVIENNLDIETFYIDSIDEERPTNNTE